MNEKLIQRLLTAETDIQEGRHRQADHFAAIFHEASDALRLAQILGQTHENGQTEIERFSSENERYRAALDKIERECSYPEDDIQKAVVKIARDALFSVSDENKHD